MMKMSFLPNGTVEYCVHAIPMDCPCHGCKFEALMQERDDYREALGFYANKDAYLLVETENTRTIGILERDPGDSARAVLQKWRTGYPVPRKKA